MTLRYSNTKYELPNFWVWQQLESIANVLSGATPKGVNATKSSEESQTPFFKVSDMNLAGNEIRMQKAKLYLNDKQLKKLKVKVHPEGTIIFPKRGGAILTNKKRILSRESGYDLNLMGLKSNENVVFDLFLWNWLLRIDLASLYDGSNVPQINNKDVAPLYFPIPPQPEQRAIVAKIEQLFSELDNGIANLKTAKDKLEIYRQAVLKKAFEGELTKEWRKKQNLSLADWELNPLSTIAKKITDGEHFRPPTQNSGIYFLSAKDIRDGGIDFSSPLFISEETAKKALKRCNPERDDILIVSRGATVGRICIVKTDKVFCLLGSVILLKVKKGINSLFLTYILKSPKINRKLITLSGSTAQQAIYLRDIKKIEIPLPSLEEQTQIVKEIETRLSVCDNAIKNIDEALEKSEALRQSILKKAFEGKLLSDAELQACRQEPDWEPAEKLLERIKKEKK